MKPESKFYNTQEAADELGCCTRTVRDRVKSGDLEAKRDGRRLLIHRWSVDGYLNGLPSAKASRR